MIIPVAKLTVHKENEAFDHNIYMEILGNLVYMRIKPAIADKRLEDSIKAISGDILLEFSAFRMDEEMIKKAKKYMINRLEASAKEDKIFKQCNVQVEEIVGGE